MKYLIATLLLLCGCSDHHRLVLLYETGQAATQSSTELDIKGDKDA